MTTDMHRYFAKLYRQRVLLLMPVLVCVLASAVVVALQPRTYRASASLWFGAVPTFDTTAYTGTPIQTPSEIAADTFRELLGTRSFAINIGHRSGLSASLTDEPLHAPRPRG